MWYSTGLLSVKQVVNTYNNCVLILDLIHCFCTAALPGQSCCCCIRLQAAMNKSETTTASPADRPKPPHKPSVHTTSHFTITFQWKVCNMRQTQTFHFSLCHVFMGNSRFQRCIWTASRNASFIVGRPDAVLFWKTKLALWSCLPSAAKLAGRVSQFITRQRQPSDAQAQNSYFMFLCWRLHARFTNI